ncbi:hypothetical protein Dda_2789 [Drechslerella dactyloides]|uniref:Thioesterase/thiol ester dehydrase-isomerase n=1 Tax=Drechslerella dactyloides TaxID=74499 RepID=A0AAD6J052_DREDA|nr:hypothetical protein Dda_2789 [Drechslerella dactyloides]
MAPGAFVFEPTGKAGPASFVKTMALREVISPRLAPPPATVDLNSSAGKSNDGSGTGTRGGGGGGSDDINDAAGKRRVFWSIGPIFVPIDGIYGGHLLGQAVYAAYQTVEAKFYCHSVSSNFLIQGRPKLPLCYTVETLREGKSYCTRHVQIRQPAASQQHRPLDAAVIFVATVSFKTAEARGLESQVPPPRELRSWVASPRRHEVAPAVDIPCWMEFIRKKRIPSLYNGVEIRKVDMEAANRSRPLHEHRKIQIYRPVGQLPPDQQSILSLCAHIYASDRNGMFAITDPHNVGNDIIHTGSLSHTLIFHANPTKLLFRPSDSSSSSDSDNDGSSPDWAVLEQFGDGASEGRGVVRGRLWNVDGTLLATTVQDAVVRVRVDEGGSGQGGKKMRTFSELLKSML